MSLLKGHDFRKSEVKVYSFIYKTIHSSPYRFAFAFCICVSMSVCVFQFLPGKI